MGICCSWPIFGVIFAKFLTDKDPKNWFNRNQIDTQYRYDVYEAADQVSAKVTVKFLRYLNFSLGALQTDTQTDAKAVY